VITMMQNNDPTSTGIDEHRGAVPLAKIISDNGWSMFDARYLNDGGDTGKYLIAIKEEKFFILKKEYVDSLGGFDVEEQSSILSNIRLNCYREESAFNEGRDYDCGFAVYHMKYEDWFFVPYSVDVIEDVEGYEKLEEVL
jgi:hypothetical protein